MPNSPPDRCKTCNTELPPDGDGQRTPCPHCGGTSRIIPFARFGVLAASVNTTLVATGEIRDQLVVDVSVPAGATERVRLLARIEALIKAIRAIGDSVVDKDKKQPKRRRFRPLFIASLARLEQALGIAKGTEDDLIDGRVL